MSGPVTSEEPQVNQSAGSSQRHASSGRAGNFVGNTAMALGRFAKAFASGLKSNAKMVAGKIGAPLIAAGAVVAKALGISQTAATVITAGFVLAFGGMGVAAVASGIPQDQWIAIISDDDDDCVKVVAAAQKKYGKGERQIPEESCGYRVGYIATYEGNPDAIAWSAGTAQRAVYNAWKENGSVIDANGYARMGEGDDAPYIVATSLAAYGLKEGQRAFVGEQITFYFDSGASLTCIIGDAKGSPSEADPNDLDVVHTIVDQGAHGGLESGTGWGHIHGSDIDVLEFWGTPGNNYAHLGSDYEGHRVDSFTPEGLAESVKNAEGWSDSFMDEAISATVASGNKTIHRASGECRAATTKKDVDNSDMARAAISFAWPHAKPDAEGNQGTELYQEVWGALEAAGKVASWGHGMDCGVCVASAVLWSGSDDDYSNGTGAMDAHMRSSPRWEFVGTLADLSNDDMEPGDVCVNPSSHVFMYVGSELIREMQPEADPNANCVSASLGQRSAGCDNSVDLYRASAGSSYNVYRCIDPQHSDKYTGIAGGFSGA